MEKWKEFINEEIDEYSDSDAEQINNEEMNLH